MLTLKECLWSKPPSKVCFHSEQSLADKSQITVSCKHDDAHPLSSSRRSSSSRSSRDQSRSQAAGCAMSHNTSRTQYPAGQKICGSTVSWGRRCKNVYKIRLWGKTVLWRRCKSVRETIAIRHVSCIQFSEISAAQVHADSSEEHLDALLRA